MSAAGTTLLLDQSQWDLVLDVNGNIALASPPYSLAQDVASAVRTFLGEVYYNTTLGIKFFGNSPAALVQAINAQAMTVPGVVTVQTTITSFTATIGGLVGQLVFTDDSGEAHTVSL